MTTISGRFSFEKRFHGLPVGEVGPDEAEVFVILQKGEARLLQGHVVVGVQVVETDHGVSPCEKAPGEMEADETRRAGYENPPHCFHLIDSVPCLACIPRLHAADCDALRSCQGKRYSVFEDLLAGVERPGDVISRVGEGDETGFELGRGEIDPRGKHPPEETAEEFRVAPGSRGEIDHLIGGEEEGEHRADTVDPEGDPLSGEELPVSGAEIRGHFFEGRVGFPLEEVQCGDPGRHGEGIAREGSRLVNGSRGGEVFHDLPAAAEGADGEAAPDDLPQAGKIGGDAGQGLPAAVGDAESGDHLVEDQEDAVLAGDLPQRFEESRPGGDHPHVAGDRFDDDAGQIPAEALDGVADRGGVVVRQRDRQFGQLPGNAGASGYPERGHPRARLYEERIGMAVIAAGELDDLLPAGNSRGRGGWRSWSPRFRSSPSGPSRSRERRPRSARAMPISLSVGAP